MPTMPATYTAAVGIGGKHKPTGIKLRSSAFRRIKMDPLACADVRGPPVMTEHTVLCTRPYGVLLILLL